jgi:hypothetical protein
VKLTRTLVRIVGWLLTPLVAWAASFLGAALGAWISGGAREIRTVFLVTMIFGGVFALVSAWAWLRLLRRSTWLQHTLEVAPDGTPLAAIEEEPSRETP